MTSSFGEQWDTWREPIVAEMQRLFEEVKKNPRSRNATHHPLDRPGLLFYPSEDPECTPVIAIRAPHFRALNIVQNPVDGYRITGFYRSLEPGIIHVNARPHRPWRAQSHDVRTLGEHVFEHALATLEAATFALKHATPLNEPDLHWKDALVQHLQQSPSNGWQDASQWLHWIKRWGDARMVSTAEMTGTLLPPGSPEWRRMLLQSWCETATEPSVPLPDSLQF